MGWFSNTNNAARQINNTALDSLVTHISAKNTLLEQCKDQTTEVLNKLQLLSLAGALKAPALLSQSHALGQQLGQTMNDIQSHAGELHTLIDTSEAEMMVANSLIQNYSMPRLQRAINMSGQQMALIASTQVQVAKVALPIIEDAHTEQMNKAKQTMLEVSAALARA